MLARFNRKVDAGHLRNADVDDRHESDGRIIALDVDNSTSSDLRDEALGFVGSGGVSFWSLAFSFVGETRFPSRIWDAPSPCTEAFPVVLGVISARLVVDFDDCPTNRTVPTMIAQCTEEGLIDCPTSEFGGKGILSKHVDQRVRLGFQPEGVAMSNIATNVEGR